MRQNDETPCSEPQIRWLLDAAERGYLDEQYELAMCYLEGNGLEKDYARAVEWFRKAAEQEHPRAQLELGRCYKNGYGVLLVRTLGVIKRPGKNCFFFVFRLENVVNRDII